MKPLFKLKEYGTTVQRELLAGATTFFAMSYILFVNPAMLSTTGMNFNAVFLATILAAVIGTLVMGLFANVPYALAPGMGLNAFFTYTICGAFGFSWQEALAMVFICGVINIIITVTKVRKYILKAIPQSLRSAIGAGIGLFIAYIGFKNAGFLNFTTPFESSGLFGGADVTPGFTNFSTPAALLAGFGLIVIVVLIVLKIKGAILIGIVSTTIFAVILTACGVNTGIDFNTVKFSADSWGFKELGETFGVALGKDGIGALFTTSVSKLPIAILAIFAFSITDTFDTIGTFIGTSKKAGIFTETDEIQIANSKGFATRMDRALFADSIATSIGAILGTSNTTTYVESAAGIEVGGRTGLTAVFVAGFFLLSIMLAPIAGLVPGYATAPALIVVGVMMMGSLKEIEWNNFADAVPAFLTVAMMGFAYNVSTGVAFGFIFYCIIAICQGKIKEIHPILYVSTLIFVVYFVFMGLMDAGIIKVDTTSSILQSIGLLI